jgi:hypothetical protein
MDGALKPNQEIERAVVLGRWQAPDNLVRDRDRFLFSSGSSLVALTMTDGSAVAEEINHFDSLISALASDGAGGLAIGLDDGRIVFGGNLSDRQPVSSVEQLAPTALSFGFAGELFVCSGSGANRPSAWKRDLMQRNASGSVWRFDTSSSKGECLARGLAFPHGIALLDEGTTLVIAESWRHRVVRIDLQKSTHEEKQQTLLDDLPGYPARISSASDGYWLAVFAPRGQLIELVLKEKAYRERMMANVPPEYWVAPALSSGKDFLEPMQLGALRVMGTIKPWAPTRSYGLLVRLDSRFRPVDSAHSRSDGTRHGITSCVEWNDRLIFTSKGDNLLLSMNTNVTTGV